MHGTFGVMCISCVETVWRVRRNVRWECSIRPGVFLLRTTVVLKPLGTVHRNGRGNVRFV